MSDLLFVTGATGKIGRHVCLHALERGMRVRALTRDPERASDLAEHGAEIVTGALGDEDVARHMEGADAAFVMVPLGPDTLDIGRATHDALEEAGIERAVRLSVVTPIAQSDTFLGRWHSELDVDFAARDLTTAVVRPHSFMENLLGSARTIREGQLVGANGDGRTPYIAASDVALCAVALVASRETCAGTHDLTGPTAPNGAQVADVLSSLIDHDVEWVHVEPSAYERMLGDAGLPDLFIELVTDLARLTREGVGADPTHGFERITGRKPEDLASWISRHRSAFVAEASDA